MNFIKLLWIGYFIIILFFRFSFEGKIVIVIYSVLLALITIIRSINSRNEWREIAAEYHKNLEEKD